MLLPAQEGEEEEDDPRLEITRPLLEYLRIKSAAEQLAERNLLGDKTFVRKPDNRLFDHIQDDQVIRIGLFELIDAFQSILDKVTPSHRVNLTRDRISVQERISQLTEILEANESMTFDELFEECREKPDIIVTFLAILEMAKTQFDSHRPACTDGNYQNFLPMMDNDNHATMPEDLKYIIESLLFVSETPLTVEQIKKVLENVDTPTIKTAITQLAAEYEQRDGGFVLREIAGGYQFRTQERFNQWIKRLVRPSAPRISKAALENTGHHRLQSAHHP